MRAETQGPINHNLPGYTGEGHADWQLVDGDLSQSLTSTLFHLDAYSEMVQATSTFLRCL